jgi:phospholipid/cholesterol/gamma-HCH transport system substrate-binding protein
MRPAATARAATVAALVAAVAAIALAMFGAGGDYRVSVVVQNAGQLVEGNEVKVGGVPVGLVERVQLTRDGRARLELSIADDELAPLHEGTVATVRAASLSGIANRYVALAPGRNDAPAIEDGGELRAEDAHAAVDLDQVLNTLDAATRDDLAATLRLADRWLEPARELNAALEAFEPALTQSAATMEELRRDDRDLGRVVVAAADVAEALNARPAELEQLVPSTLAAVDQLASERRALDATLARLPETLATANTTLVNVRELARELRPAVRAAGPAADPLAELLPKLVRVGRTARPELRALRSLVDARGEHDLVGVVRGLPALDRASEPTVASLLENVPDLLRVLRDVRPYTPEVVAGQLHGFGGVTTGYYDANGHYGRISAQGSPFALNQEGTLLGLTGVPTGLQGYRTRINRRCPGGATQPAPDGSNPWRDGRGDDFPCDPAHTAP